MRKWFESDLPLDGISIESVELDAKSRHQLPKLLAGLQYIFITPSLHEAVFHILESSVCSKTNKTGRKGMSLWELFVMGVLRLNLDMDYDTLRDIVNNHNSVRGILGVQTRNVFDEKAKHYPLQTIKDNVSLLDEQTLNAISLEVVKAGHELKKKESDLGAAEPISLKLKTDSYAVESNIHFPTDINLLYDSGRKCLDMILKLSKEEKLEHWRKVRAWYKQLKKRYRKVSNIHRKKGANYKERLEVATKKYLKTGRDMEKKLATTLLELDYSNLQVLKIRESLLYYKLMLVKHIDLVERRIIKGEKIPHSEKIFSIFEPHVEWIKKGKAGNKVELGHNTVLTTDQHHFILDHEVMVKESDSQQPIKILNRLQEKFATGYTLESISFDRGFYSKLSVDALSKAVTKLVMPSKGRPKKEAKDQGTEVQKQLTRKLMNKHSAVESNINELEHSGVNKVPDKGIKGFKKYVAMGVLAYNLKRLGKMIIDQKLLPTQVALNKAA